MAEPNISQENETTSVEENTNPQKPKFKINFHLVIVGLILLIAIVSVYKLVKWNIGTKSDFDPNYTTTDFDIETLDMIIPMNSTDLAGHVDDGVTTILCLGNAPFSDERGDIGLAARIADKTGATVYNCAFPNSAVACKNAVYDPAYSQDQFNFYYVVECFRNNNFSSIHSLAEANEDSNYINAVLDMEAVDMSAIDVMLIMYDSTDYNIMSPSDNPANEYDVTAYTGAMRTTLKNIRETWPYIRVIVMSHSYAQYMDANGNVSSGTTTDLGNGNLNHYLVKEVDVAMDCGVSIVDNYFGTINEDNYEQYMRDYMHYNDEGREALANRISEIINTKSGVVETTTN